MLMYNANLLEIQKFFIKKFGLFIIKIFFFFFLLLYVIFILYGTLSKKCATQTLVRYFCNKIQLYAGKSE